MELHCALGDRENVEEIRGVLCDAGVPLLTNEQTE